MSLFKKAKAKDYVVLKKVKVTYSLMNYNGNTNISFSDDHVNIDAKKLIYERDSELVNVRLRSDFMKEFGQELVKTSKKNLQACRQPRYVEDLSHGSICYTGEYIVKCVPSIEVLEKRPMTRKEFKKLKL